jgi:hypothetical protein
MEKDLLLTVRLEKYNLNLYFLFNLSMQQDRFELLMVVKTSELEIRGA